MPRNQVKKRKIVPVHTARAKRFEQAEEYMATVPRGTVIRLEADDAPRSSRERKRSHRSLLQRKAS